MTTYGEAPLPKSELKRNATDFSLTDTQTDQGKTARHFGLVVVILLLFTGILRPGWRLTA